MKVLIDSRVRDTKEMELILMKEGNPNDCYSTFNHMYYDKRDGTFYQFCGHFWGGIDNDTLTKMGNQEIDEYLDGYSLSDSEVKRLTELGFIKE